MPDLAKALKVKSLPKADETHLIGKGAATAFDESDPRVGRT
jgi:hypothetical protein